MTLFKELVKKYGLGMILGAATLDGYGRQVINERNNSIIEVTNKEKISLSEDIKVEYDKIIEESSNLINNQIAKGIYTEAAVENQKIDGKYKSYPNDYNNNEMVSLHNKLEDSFYEIQKLDISEILTTLYNKYSEILDTLTSDKIACLFNIIIDGLILSSFLSVLSIMLSENIINKIGFLEKYPRILKLVKLRNSINKTVSKFYLIMHFIIIMFGILGNIFMFFL